MTDGERFDTPVAGGQLAAFRLGPSAGERTPVLAIHGITANSQSWVPVATAGIGRALIAVDLRGRGRSNELPAPFGIASHVRDMLAVLDHLGIERTVVVGHSLGAYIAVSLALAQPERIERLVLVDGGLTIPLPPDTDPAGFVPVFLARTVARLRTSFPDRDAYRAWWHEHPAMVGEDVDGADLDRYADHDLVGVPPDFHSAVNPAVVEPDGTDLFTLPDATALELPAVLLCAPRGLQNELNPMQPLALAEAWAAADPERRQVVLVPDVNHYTITLGHRGAQAVAAALS